MFNFIKGDVLHCQVDGCNYKTTKRSQLVSHMKSHFQIKTFFCKECGQGFVAKSHLKRHHLTHVPIKPFSCDCCDYRSNRKDKLQLHVRKHHCANPTVDLHPKVKAELKTLRKVAKVNCKVIDSSQNDNSSSSCVNFEQMIEKVDEQLQKRSVNKFTKNLNSVKSTDGKCS